MAGRVGILGLVLLAGCATVGGWPGGPRSVDPAAVAKLVETGAPRDSAEDIGLCGAVLAFDAKRRAPDTVAFSPDHTARVQARLLLMTLSSPDPGLSAAIGETIFALPPATAGALAARVPSCEERYGRLG